MELSNEDKLIIRVIKGHYSQYENPIQFLVGEIYALELKYIDEHKILYHLIKLYSKLWESGYIYLEENPVLDLLIKFNELGKRPLAPKSLYDMVYSSISNIKVKGLELDKVDSIIFENCKLKEKSNNE